MESVDKSGIIDQIIGKSPNRLRESYFNKHNRDLLSTILEYTVNIPETRFPYKVWHWVNNQPLYIKCPCGARVSENMNWRLGYKKFCSNKCSSNSLETKTKLKETNKKKWGVEHYSQTTEYVDKVKQTSQKKWGVDNYSKTAEFLEKAKKTSLSKWGVDSFTKTPEFLEKSKKTSLKNWGVEFPGQSTIIKEKIKQTNFKRYGVSHIFEYNGYRDSVFRISSDSNYISYEGGLNVFRCDSGHGHEFTISTDDYYGRTKAHNKLCTICYPISDSSSLKEKGVFDFIKSHYTGEIISGYRQDRLEIDIYLPELRLGFEFNGLWWHSSKYKEKSYHRKKTEHFKLVYQTEPDYKYLVNNQRIHKSRYRKSNLAGGISESQHMREVPKIWDCGKIKFELIK